MKLSARLRCIIDMMPNSDVVCDVGTDHAYIPIELINTEKCNRSIATDIGRGPLIRAEKNISKYGLNSVIETRLGYGLMPVSEKECDTIIIAGMGGLLITEILENSIETAKNAKALIIQPMYVPELVRGWLGRNGFAIASEQLVKEGSKIYVVIYSRFDGVKRKLNELHSKIGPRLIKERHPLLKEYLYQKIRQQKKIVLGLKKAKIKDFTVLAEQDKLFEDMRVLYDMI